MSKIGVVFGKHGQNEFDPDKISFGESIESHDGAERYMLFFLQDKVYEAEERIELPDTLAVEEVSVVHAFQHNSGANFHKSQLSLLENSGLKTTANPKGFSHIIKRDSIFQKLKPILERDASWEAGLAQLFQNLHMEGLLNTLEKVAVLCAVHEMTYAEDEQDALDRDLEDLCNKLIDGNDYLEGFPEGDSILSLNNKETLAALTPCYISLLDQYSQTL